MLKLNCQAQESENLLRAQRETEELRKQNTILTSRQESIIRNLRAETKVKMELFSALGRIIQVLSVTLMKLLIDILPSVFL